MSIFGIYRVLPLDDLPLATPGGGVRFSRDIITLTKQTARASVPDRKGLSYDREPPKPHFY